MDLNQQVFFNIFEVSGKWPAVDAAGIFLAVYGIWVLFFGVFGLVAWSAVKLSGRDWRLARISAVGLLVRILFLAGTAWLLASVLKGVFMTLRPALALGVEPLIQAGGTHSFPSGHTTGAFALVTSFWLWLRCQVFYNKQYRRLITSLYLLALLIGVSRIFAGVHFPSDILGGVVVGVLLPVLVYYLSPFLRH